MLVKFTDMNGEQIEKHLASLLEEHLGIHIGEISKDEDDITGQNTVKFFTSDDPAAVLIATLSEGKAGNYTVALLSYNEKYPNRYIALEKALIQH